MKPREAWLIAIAAALALAFGFDALVVRGEDDLLAPAARQRAATAPIAEDFGWPLATPKEAYAILFERPPFAASRRPPEPPTPPPTPEAAQAKPQDHAATLSLVGIVAGPQGRIALLRTASGVRRVIVGDRIGAWQVSEISDKQVQISRGRAKQVLVQGR
jgi:Tfp pilus assembly protein PilP